MLRKHLIPISMSKISIPKVSMRSVFRSTYLLFKDRYEISQKVRYLNTCNTILNRSSYLSF